MAVDLLWSDGRPTTELPWELRRRQLDDLRLDGPGWRTSPLVDPDAAYDLVAAAGTGVVAKRAESRYVVGRSTDDWVIAR